MKNILIIAFHYPPDNSSTGVLRTLKFSRYLLNHGWRSHILTVTPEIYTNRDERLLAQVPPEVSVTRIPCRDAKEAWGIRGHYPAIAAMPDRYGSWRRPAIAAGLQLIREQQFDAIFSTYPIASAHLIGLALKRKTGLPWLADFRDPWAGGGGRGWEYRLHAWLEGRVVRHADRVIANTDLARADFLARYPALSPERVVTITNGYDEEDFASLPPVEPAQPFTLVYPGTIDPVNRSPLPLLQALGALLRNGRLREDELRLHFLGAGVGFTQPWFTQAVAEQGLGNMVTGAQGRIPYAESLQVLASAGLLLVLNEPLGAARETDLGYSRLMVPAKVYEYLRLGRPLLALCGEGAVPDLLASTGGGWACSPMDVQGIADAIMQARQMALSGQAVAVPRERIAAFERRALTARLAALLEDVAGG